MVPRLSRPFLPRLPSRQTIHRHAELREKIVAEYPRKHFKEGFIREYFAGFAHKPGTTCGTVNAGVCERYIPGFKCPNACDLIAASPFPDTE